jgi:hypothetical protein
LRARRLRFGVSLTACHAALHYDVLPCSNPLPPNQDAPPDHR